jgi:hypothetical protein
MRTEKIIFMLCDKLNFTNNSLTKLLLEKLTGIFEKRKALFAKSVVVKNTIGKTTKSVLNVKNVGL